ncbi:MAG: hypothetical protein HOP29_13875 [Phycisphaerales bacterium]|nr:hypothetical protein [Phycisphaerales bacterium]
MTIVILPAPSIAKHHLNPKKADVTERPEVFDHVGVLRNGPPGKAGVPFVKSSDDFESSADPSRARRYALQPAARAQCAARPAVNAELRFCVVSTLLVDAILEHHACGDG